MNWPLKRQHLINSMKIIILGGFLGSGKTSVLLQLAEYLVKLEKDYHSETKVAILENEIGTIGIDDKLIRNAGFSVENLFSGCACCTLTGELIGSINKIEKDLNPEWLIIEATGVAYPAGIRKAVLEGNKIDSTILIIADAKRFPRLANAMESLVFGQLETASMILLNKADLVSNLELEKVTNCILNINNAVEVVPVSAKETIALEILGKIAIKAEVSYGNKA
ncbi:GTP-binding protein [Eubacteriaceae bacterium ES2]|nr:GTP-binding protein [Eubacteriaceae bacterium ES2]